MIDLAKAGYPLMMTQPQVCEVLNISRWSLVKRRPEMVRRGVVIHQSYGPHTHYKYERDSLQRFLLGTVTTKFQAIPAEAHYASG